MHAAEAASAMHATEAASAAAVAAEAASATAVSTATATSAATSGEGRRCQSKRGGDHTGNQTLKGPVVHLISPLLNRSGQSRRRKHKNQETQFVRQLQMTNESDSDYEFRIA
jgi:hypothetical protein